VELENGRLVIALTVPRGIDKPYFDRNGVIWLKSAADKRRVNSKEELRRLFQSVDQFHADELPAKAGIDKLDRLRFRDFLRDVYQQEFPDAPQDRVQLLQNMIPSVGTSSSYICTVIFSYRCANSTSRLHSLWGNSALSPIHWT